MDMQLKEMFLGRWQSYFNQPELPITFYYSNREENLKRAERPSGHQCLIGALAKVRAGKSLCFDVDAIGCGGGKRYLGFTEGIRPKFEYFLSCGIPGEMEGERYKKTPDIVLEAMKILPPFKAPAKFIIFKRWDHLEKDDDPEVVIFFARPDILAGLFTLSNYDEIEPNGVYAPFSAGCGSIVHYPYLERNADRPRSVLGMFDVSARPYVPKDILSFAVPINKFVRMIENMDESFLITPSWDKVRRRIA
jgi:uncharacterized protein (DUF169 family)